MFHHGRGGTVPEEREQLDPLHLPQEIEGGECISSFTPQPQPMNPTHLPTVVGPPF